MAEIAPDICEDQRAAARLCRGVRRLLWTWRYASVTEFPLPNGRRADIFGITNAAEVAIVEIKSSVADFKSDRKWSDYRPFCDAFYFAVGGDFPQSLIPEDCGLIVADAFGAAVIRPAPTEKLPTPRRKALIQSFAQLAATRLHRLEDPLLGEI
jgi:hypothetical protein